MALLVLMVVSCTPDPPMPEMERTVQHEFAAFLSVAGTDANDVWVVGAQPGLLQEPVVLHWDGTDWDTISTEQQHPMWWVHPFEAGPTFIGGGGATVLKIEGDTVERTNTPKFLGTPYTAYGAQTRRRFGRWEVSLDETDLYGAMTAPLGPRYPSQRIFRERVRGNSQRCLKSGDVPVQMFGFAAV